MGEIDDLSVNFVHCAVSLLLNTVCHLRGLDIEISIRKYLVVKRSVLER